MNTRERYPVKTTVITVVIAVPVTLALLGLGRSCGTGFLAPQAVTDSAPTWVPFR